MKTYSDVSMKHSISTRLLTVVFAIYLGVAVVVTLLHIWAEYVETRKQVVQELHVLQKAFERGVATSLWYLDIPLLESEMRGMLEHYVVVGVKIENDQGEGFTIGETHNQPDKNTEVVTSFRVSAEQKTGESSPLLEHSFPLTHIAEDDEGYEVGTASLYSSYTVILRRLQWKLLLILLASIINMVAFWVIVLFVGQRMLSRPLAILTEGARQLNLDNLEYFQVDIRTKGRDELKLLEETFNIMVKKLLDARTTLYEYANALNQNRQQLQDILDNATAVIFMKDTDGRYLLINRQFESLFHITQQNILGKTDHDIFSKEVADAFSDNDRQVMNTNASLKLEEYAPHDDGIHTYMSIKFPLHAANDEICAVCGIATDISERKAVEERIRKLNQELEHRVQERTARLSESNALLQESEQRLKEAQRIAYLGNWDWNITTNTLFWSDEIYHIFGLQPQKFGATYEAFLATIHHKDREAVVQAINAALYEGKPYSIEHRIMLPDGTVRIVYEQGEVTFDDRQKPIRILGTVQDISARKQMEDDLRHAKDAAEAASRAKSTFIANMSHELRTPLNSILGFAQQLEQDAALTEPQQQSAGIIYRNGDHLLTLLNDILDFTKIDTNRLVLYPTEFALPGMLAQLADITRLTAERNSLEFVYETPDELPHLVSGDQKRLRQILMNLLGNAVNFTKRGEVMFRVNVCSNRFSDIPTPNPSQEGNKKSVDALTTNIRFEVEDTGIGISPEQFEAIFQPFQQADPYKLQEGSTGLGLAISQRLVQMLGSQLHVTSTEGQGTTFWFDLELPVAETLASQRAPASLTTPEEQSGFDEPIPPLPTLLPADWIATLRQAAEETDIEALFEVIAQIRERAPGLADALARLAEDFEYDEILGLLQQT